MNNNKEYIKGKKFIDNIIKESINERDLGGYRENLGYDQEIKVSVFIESLNLPYNDKSNLMVCFYTLCESI